MRAGEVRQAIADVVSAITVDAARAGGRDSLRHLEARGVEVNRAPERAFTVTLAAQPQLAPYYTEDCHQAEWLVTVLYAASEDVEDRIAQDGERIVARLHRLHEQDGDLYAAAVTPLGIVQDEGQLISTYSVAATYRADAIVAANSAA